MRSKLLISWFALLSCPLTVITAQETALDRWENVLETLLSDEDLSSDAREELQFMYESLHESPLNINTATREDLAQLPFLTYEQIEDIHAYVYMHGPMLSLGELQLTGSLDYATRQLLREFVYAGSPPPASEDIRLKDVLRYGRTEIAGRMDMPMYMREGFRYHSPDELKRYPNRAYLGNRLSHSLRYSFNWHNRIRFGITADKDAGEPFMGRNRAGYDFWSGYLYLKDIGCFKELAAGNFKAQFGYGLLLGGGFSTGKNMALTAMEGNSQGLKPHSSTQEYGYLCGIGAAWGSSRTTYSLLAAYTPVDATLKGDSLISSFKEDGYHRTELEWSKKHNASVGTLAANVRYSYRGLRYGATFLTEKLSLPYKGRDTYTGLSADFSLRRPRYALCAELSFMQLKPALIVSAQFRLQRGWTINSILRHYSPEYMSLHSNAMADVSVQNETGLLAGVSHSGRSLKLSGYADLIMHPEPRYGAGERSYGIDMRAEADCRLGRRDNLLVTARFKSKQKDCKYTARLEYCITGRYRLRWTHSCRNGDEVGTQLFYARYDFIAQPISNGWALTQSYTKSLLNGKLNISLSGAAFMTDSYDSRISVYESGLRYAYNFMSLYGKGGRVAATLRYKPSEHLQLNLKVGGTRYLDSDEISSGQQRIPACHKEDVSLQFIVKL